MNANNIENLEVSLYDVIADAKLDAQNLLNQLALNPNLRSIINTSFGKNFSRETLEQFYQQWSTNNFDNFPEIEVRSTNEINGANGAFSRDSNKIYLSRDFLIQYQDNSLAITNLLLEEYGHFIDTKINVSDSPGDEGAIFTALVRGKELSHSELEVLKNEDDIATINLDGEIVNIEQSIPDIVLYSNSWEIKDYKFSFKTADYLNKWTDLNISNQYYYNSGNDFIATLPFDGRSFNLLSGSVGKIGGNAGFRMEPGFIEAGFEVKAGYNLGEFNFEIPLSASVNAGIVNNQFTIDVDANLNLPQFNYTLPYAYAYLDAVLGYDLKLDGFVNGYVDYFLDTYEFDKTFKIIDVEGRREKRLVQLDTRTDNNFIDLIYKKIELGGDKGGSIPRTETSGYLSLDFELPRFNSSFQPIDGLENEYIWEIKEEKQLVKADFALDNLLAQIPYLAWLSDADSIDFSLAGYDFGLEYDWRAIALDLSTSLDFGYNFKTGVTDLYPQLIPDKSEIDNLVLPSFSNKTELLDALEKADAKNNGGDGEFDIDIVVEFNPKIIFEADAYLKPEVNFDWDIGVIGGKLSPLTDRKEFTLFDGEPINLFSEKIPIVPLTRREVSFKELYRWITGTEANFTDITLEIPFTAIDPTRYGTDGLDFFTGTDGDDGTKKLGKGDDYWVFSTGNDGVIDGGEGNDTLKIDRPGTYTLSTNSITDNFGNITSFANFESFKINGRDSTSSGINISEDLSNNSDLRIVGFGSDFNDTIIKNNISYLNTGKGDDVVTGSLEISSNSTIITGEGNDEITVSKTTLSSKKTTIEAGAGDDNVNLTIIPSYADTEIKSFLEVDLDTGKDTIISRMGSPSNSGTALLPVNLLVTGHLGGKTIDLTLEPNNYQSQVILEGKASVIRNLFGLEHNANVDRLFIDIANSNITYSLDKTNPNAIQLQDSIINADELKLDLTNSKFSSVININPQNFAASNLIIDGDDAFTEVLIDTSNLGDISTIPTIEVNVDKVKVNSINFDFLERKLRGEFRTLDLSERETGIFIPDNFLSYSGQSLDIFEVIFTNAKDSIYLSPSANDITTVGTPDLRGELMSFYLGEGDDRFHDRAGFRDSLIYPGSGNNFIYGAGGFDEVFYERGSGFDYQITVVDDRTVEVYYKPDDTTDTLIDVEAINFEGADELVENPYYQGKDPEKAYTTFTLQVTKEDNWNQPPFIFSPFTYFVPFGTTEISLTKDLLLSNVYDPQGNEDQLEISYIDVYTRGNSNPRLDTTDPSADNWEVTISEGLNDGIEPVVIEYEVDNQVNLQGNYLEIYPSTELSYISAKTAIDLKAFGESESIKATEFDDTVSSGSGDDTLEGNNGNDLLNGEDGNDSLDGGAGNDSLNGGTGNDNILGEEGNDFLEGNDGEDILEGNDGNDTLNGGAGKDLLLGGNGDDTYILQINESAGDIIQDIQGNDSIKVLTDSNTEATVLLSVPTSGTIGISRQDSNLIIDLNQNGLPNSEDDLTILDFFNESGNSAGKGFIENIANLSGTDIVSFFTNDIEPGNLQQGTSANDTLIGGSGND